MNTQPFVSVRISHTLGVVAILILGLLPTGCGKKTFPKPLTEQAPPQVRDLQAEVRANGVELIWSVPQQLQENEGNLPYRYSVQKSELQWDKRNCLDCPALSQEIVQVVDPSYPEPAVMKERKITLVDPGVTPEHAYRYQIEIQDPKGRSVSISTPAIARVLSPPAVASDFRVIREPQGILLQWKAPRKNVQGKALPISPEFHVERRSRNAPWETISPAPIKGNSFQDTAVASNQFYEYRVLSLLPFEDTLIWGEPSAIKQIKAPDALPPPPPNTVWGIPAKGALEIHWTESDGKVEGYHVYRREGKAITRLTANPIAHPPYVDHSVKHNSLYSYAVSAVSSRPESREGLLSKWIEIRGLLFE